jgi:hypothetical protein
VTLARFASDAKQRAKASPSSWASIETVKKPGQVYTLLRGAKWRRAKLATALVRALVKKTAHPPVPSSTTAHKKKGGFEKETTTTTNQRV